MTRRKNRSSDDTSSKSTSSADPFRHLEDKLAGVIFGCTDETYDECIKEGVFGLPMGHLSYVRGIKPGTPLFLFNYSRRELHGVFTAASKGQMNIRPHGWRGGTTEKTSFPAQVRVRPHKKAKPLKEHQFKKAIQQNYDCDGPLFQFELDGGQVKLLCRLFKSTVPRIQTTQSPAVRPPQIRPNAVQHCLSGDGDDVHVAVQKSSSPSVSRSKRRFGRKPPSLLVPSSSFTEEDGNSVLDGLGKYDSRLSEIMSCCLLQMIKRVVAENRKRI